MRLQKGTIYIKDIQVHGYIGALPQEQLTGNHYTVNLEMDYPLDLALETDQLEHTADYAEVTETVRRTMNERHALLEYAAGKIATQLFNQFPKTIALTIDICKTDPPISIQTNGAGVRLTFTNN